MDSKNYLILSNGCFSMTDSNGRTLAKLLSGVDRQYLSQFYTYGTPDFSVCENYYRVTDGDALRSFVRFKQYGGKIEAADCVQGESAAQISVSGKKIKKTPLSMLLRELAWALGKWNGKNLQAWIDSVNADAVILFVADNIFLIRLAIRVAKQKNIPIFIYTTEEYNFKNYNYLTKRPSMLYALFHKLLQKWYKRLEKYVVCGFFNSPMLADAYRAVYSCPCEVVYNTSTVDFIEKAVASEQMNVSYAGNLGVGRCYPLVELANALNELIPGAKLDVYGKLPDEQETASYLTACENINYKGFVSYNEVVDIMHRSTLVVHAEKDDLFYSRDLKYAFSTKIADSVCSGTPLLVYARGDLAVTDFLIKNKCAFVVSDKKMLKSVLQTALQSETERRIVLQNAKIVRNDLFLVNEKFKNRLLEYLRKESSK